MVPVPDYDCPARREYLKRRAIEEKEALGTRDNYDRWEDEEWDADDEDSDDEDLGVHDDFEPVSPASPAHHDFKLPAVDPARPIDGEVTVLSTPEPPRLPQAPAVDPATCPFDGDNLKPASPACPTDDDLN